VPFVKLTGEKRDGIPQLGVANGSGDRGGHAPLGKRRPGRGGRSADYTRRFVKNDFSCPARGRTGAGGVGGAGKSRFRRPGFAFEGGTRRPPGNYNPKKSRVGGDPPKKKVLTNRGGNKNGGFFKGGGWGGGGFGGGNFFRKGGGTERVKQRGTGSCTRRGDLVNNRPRETTLAERVPPPGPGTAKRGWEKTSNAVFCSQKKRGGGHYSKSLPGFNRGSTLYQVTKGEGPGRGAGPVWPAKRKLGRAGLFGGARFQPRGGGPHKNKGDWDLRLAKGERSRKRGAQRELGAIWKFWFQNWVWGGPGDKKTPQHYRPLYYEGGNGGGGSGLLQGVGLISMVGQLNGGPECLGTKKQDTRAGSVFGRGGRGAIPHQGAVESNLTEPGPWGLFGPGYKEARYPGFFNKIRI